MTVHIQSFRDDLIHVSGGWVGQCWKCRAKQWVSSGWATFWPDGEVKGWHGFSGEWCYQGCVSDRDYGGLTTVDPVHYDVQKAFLAAYELGGKSALMVMLDGEAQRERPSEALYASSRPRKRSRHGRT